MPKPYCTVHHNIWYRSIIYCCISMNRVPVVSFTQDNQFWTFSKCRVTVDGKTKITDGGATSDRIKWKIQIRASTHQDKSEDKPVERLLSRCRRAECTALPSWGRPGPQSRPRSRELRCRKLDLHSTFPCSLGTPGGYFGWGLGLVSVRGKLW